MIARHVPPEENIVGQALLLAEDALTAATPEEASTRFFQAAGDRWRG